MNFRSYFVVIAVVLAIFVFFNLTIAKDVDIQGEVYPPVINGSGGPDLFGYTWIDSDEPGGPAFAWVDISSIGTQVVLGDDQNLGPYDIGFNFSYYDNDFSSVRICSNGFISFTSTSNLLTNAAIPTAAEPNNLLAIFWDDLAPHNGGAVYYYQDVDNHRFIVSYDGVPHYLNSGALYFQVILNQDGSIYYNYASMDDAGHGNNGATIGIENGAGNDGLQVCYNADYVHAELTIRFSAEPEFNYDVAPTVFVAPTGQGQAGNPFTPIVTVENMGAMAASFPVNFTITFDGQTVYDNTVTVPEIENGEEYDAEFTEYTPDEEGDYTFTATTLLNGDENAGNNVITRGFYCLPAILPPTNLVATSNQNGVIPLRWSEPGGAPCTTIVYDDGVIDNAYYWYASTNLSANKFVAIAPVEVCTIFVHILTQGDPYWPWPDGNHDPVEVSVWDGNGSGQPGNLLYTEVATCELGQDLVVVPDEPVISQTDDVYIGFRNLSDSGPYDGLCLDAVTNYPTMKWAYLNGAWVFGDFEGMIGDQFIRASISAAGFNVLLTESNPIMDDPVITDTQELLGYSLYRDTAPDVPIDVAHRIVNQTPDLTYDDESVTNGTTYYYVVTAVYDDNGDIVESGPSNEAHATPAAGGQLAVNPTAIDAATQPGQIIYEDLDLINNGDLDVTFSIVASSDDALFADHEVPYRDGAVQAKFFNNSEEFVKQQAADEQFPPVVTGSGGPDEFGYVWIDSEEPNGPDFGWIDPSGHTPLTMTDDSNQGPFQMAFDFPFYGSSFSTFRVCSNGWMSFTSTATTYSNYALPNANAPTDLIAPFWDDMNPSLGGTVSWYSDAQMTVVSWVDVPAYGGGGPFSFQVILHANGRILFQYLNMNDPLDAATVGIQNGTQTIGLQIAYNQAYAYSGLATLIKTGWLSCEPTSGTIPAGETVTVSVIMDASDLEENIYNGSLTIDASDINGDLPQVVVPVTLDVNTAITEKDGGLPQAFALSQNYPNPFNAKTSIEFALPEAGKVDLSIYNMLGQKVATLVSGELLAGYHSVIWDASDITSGVYFYKITAGDKTEVHEMTLLK